MRLNLNKDAVISASEVGDFLFCPNSFLLKRAGIVLESYKGETAEEKDIIKRQLKLISAGRISHKKIAQKTEKIIKQEKLLKKSIDIGMVLFVVIIILVILSLFIR
jgi:hypothetical protein